MLILFKRTPANDNGVCRRVEELGRRDKHQPRRGKPPGRLRHIAEKPHLARVFCVRRNSRPYAEPSAIREELHHRLKTPSLAAVDARHGRDGVPSPSANHILPFHPRRIIRTKTNHHRAKSNHHTPNRQHSPQLSFQNPLRTLRPCVSALKTNPATRIPPP